MKFTLPLPPSINRTYRTTRHGGFYSSKESKDWTKEAGYTYLSSKNKKTFSRPIYVSITWFLKRDRDIDSGLKILLDFLQRQRIIKNDSLIKHLNVLKFIDKTNPRCEIEIEKLSI